MLKGKTIIEMTDVHTGEVEHLEDTNLITNALTKIFEPLGHDKSIEAMFSTQAPFYANLLGGLLMFDAPIEEKADTLFAPASVNLTGCAVYNQQNATTGKKRGVYNTTESEVNLHDHFVKYVYDFNTSQANGAISTICLTHRLGGYTSLGSDDAVTVTGQAPTLGLCTNTLQYVIPGNTGGNTADPTISNTVGVTEFLFVLDKDEDCAYYFKINSEKSISIVKRRAHFKSVSIFERPASEKPIIETFSLPDLDVGLLSTAFFSYNFDNEEKALYLTSCASSYSLATNATYQITKIAFGTWVTSEYACTNQTNTPLNTGGYSHYASFAYRGYLYLRGYNAPYPIFKIKVDNSADVTAIRYPEGSTYMSGYPAFAINGRLFFENPGSESNNHANVLNTENNDILLMEAGSLTGGYNQKVTYTPFIGDAFYYFCSTGTSNYGTVRIPAMYLATINNLSTPVTKTADKTMKVTYIIQEQ